MSSTIDLFTLRFIQITFIFVLFAALQQYAHIPHASWLIITSGFIYLGFDPGTVLKRAYMRFTGTIVGVAAMVIVWHLIHWDFRLGIFFAVFISWAMVFFLKVTYNRYMVIITVFSDLAYQIANVEGFLLQYYILDRLFCTAFVFGVCILIELIWFGQSNLTELNCHHILNEIHQELETLYKMTLNHRITKAALFKKIKLINQRIAHLKQLIEDQKYETMHDSFYQHAEPIVYKILFKLRRITNLVYLRINDPNNPVMVSLQIEIEQLLKVNESMDLKQ